LLTGVFQIVADAYRGMVFRAPEYHSTIRISDNLKYTLAYPLLKHPQNLTEKSLNLALGAILMTKAANLRPVEKKPRSLFSITELKTYYQKI